MAFDSWLDYRTANGLSYMFLHERGEAPEMVRVAAKFPQEIKDKLSAILGEGRSGLYELSDEEKQAVLNLYIQENFGGSREDFDKSIADHIQRIEDRLSTGKVPSFVEKRITFDLQWMKEHGYNYDHLSSFVNNIVSDIRHAGEVNDAATTTKALDYIKDNGLEKEFDEWKESLNDRYGIKEYLFAGYTPSGNQRWLPNTVENASKLMNKEGLAGATGLSVSFSRFVASLAPKKKSLSDIRASKDRLVEDRQLVDDFREKWSDVFFDLGVKCQPGASVYEDYGPARLTEAAQKKNPGAYLKKEYGVELSQEDLQKLDDMIKAIKTEFPTNYFETKFQRPVYLNEFAAAVMPTTTSEDVKQAVSEAGLPIFEYDSSVEGSRKEATLKATEGEGIRFRTEQTKNRVESLFNDAIKGTFRGKPVSIGTLTAEGKQYLESISGLTFKNKVDFMLNASDLVHMYNEHFGANEKDPGSNIPLTIDDIRNIVDVILKPERVLYLGEDEGKRFAFLAPADSGAYNLIEVYTTKKGNLSSKTFYKTKKGVSHRAMILEKESQHSTSTMNGATLSDAKIPILFDIANQEESNTRYRASNENQAIFVSNAAKAVEGIKQEKATPEQWLKMIEKNGGLKSGEDKWMGLSDWLKASDQKTLTKQEVFDFINENMIVIEEQHYAEGAEDDAENTYAMVERLLQEKFGRYIAEYYEQNNGEDDNLYGGDSYEYALSRLREEMNDEFPYTIERSHSNVYLTFPYEETDDLQEWADKLGVTFAPVNPINSIRLGYTTLGLQNNQEIALTIPTIDSWNTHDDIHFGDAGNGRAVAWIRFGETYAYIPEYAAFYDFQKKMQQKYFPDREISSLSGNDLMDLTPEERAEFERLRSIKEQIPYRESRKRRVLVIDEIQSKRHQEGREQGYSMTENEYQKRLDALETEGGERLRRRTKLLRALAEKYGEDFRVYLKLENTAYVPNEEVMAPDEVQEWYATSQDDIYNAIHDLKREKRSGIPDAPFDKNWHELAMKRMLRYAAENGYDVIAWTKGEQQAERYNLANYFSTIERQDIPEIEGRRFVLDGYRASFLVNEDGVIIGSSSFNDVENKPLADIVGKELAIRMMQMEDGAQLAGLDLAVGGEGMKGFYDKMLPAFMNKYGKKWGVKVEDVALPGLEDGSLTMHSVPVTEEMKASVMEGQVMFRIRRENESAEEFHQAVIDEYRKKYSEYAPTSLVDPYDRKAIADLYELSEDEIPEEIYEGFIYEFERGVHGFYMPGDYKYIAIFARNEIIDSRAIDDTLFHENIHALLDKDTKAPLAYGRWLYENPEGDVRTVKDFVDKHYAPAKRYEETLTNWVAPNMALGRMRGLLDAAPVQYKPMLQYILNKLKYDTEREESQRNGNSQQSEGSRVSRVSWAKPGNASESKPGKGKNAGDSREGLSEAEKAVIREYFPDAFPETQPGDTDDLSEGDGNIRYRAVTDQETLDRLNSEPTIKVYRAMQVIDGKLYPPMSAKVDGELRQPIELGQWEEAEERPDLADSKGFFKLDKGNKSSVPARYNPYFHTSRTPLNDQFSSAQTRPNLVTVEVEVPESELSSGYKAEKAKDPVGEKEWKAGVVQGKISGTRKVILSRWDKPVRIVPDSEVAERIVEMFDGMDITMPSNVVTPSLRTELEKLGVPFMETDNRGKPVETSSGVRYRMRPLNATPTEEVVAGGLDITDRQVVELAGNLFAAFPADIRKKITERMNGNPLNLQSAIFAIPAELAEKESLSDDERTIASIIAREVQSMIDAPMTRDLHISEALWMLYDRVFPTSSYALVGAAKKAQIKDNLGFSERKLKEKQDDIRYRAATQAEIDAMERNMTAADLYNRDVTSALMRLRESFQDMNRSVQKMVDAVVKKTGKAVKSFEDVMLALNRLSSKNLSDKGNFLRNFLMPMWDAVLAFKKKGKTIDDVIRYVMLKHGLERNDVLAQRDARNFYKDAYDKKIRDIEADKSLSDTEKQDKKDKAKDDFDFHVASIQAGTDAKYRELRERDYGAIMALYSDYVDIPDRMPGETVEQFNQRQRNARRPKYTDLAVAEAEAAREVEAFENANRALCDRLWKRINAATKETLRHQYEHNVISKQTYDHVRGMFEFYIPLRGFKEDTAEDIYSYYGKDISTDFANPLIRTKGRTTLAESPFGWIGSMAESAIQMDNKNDAKMRLYYFAVNRPEQNLLTLQKTWYKKTGEDADGRSIWEASYPNITPDMDHNQTRQEIERHDAEMKALAASGRATQKKSELNLRNSVVNISDKAKPEHAITVLINGEEQVMYVNGNPRSAQAINGMLNIDKGDSGLYSILGQKITRWMSRMNTSYNPAFWISNYERDLLFTIMSINVKEDKAYRDLFWSNYVNPAKVTQLLRKYEKGELDMSNPVEKAYKEFADNGGVTGFTVLANNEEYDKLLDKYSRDVERSKFIKGAKNALGLIQDFGEGAEQASRFAAYMTSRQVGRSIEESIGNAKEVTVNFNRKGSGKRITWEETGNLSYGHAIDSRPWLKWCARVMTALVSSMAPAGRSVYMFFNASIQGLKAFVSLYKKNPKKMAMWSGAYFGMGFALAALNHMINAIAGGDDDDYLDIPDWERRNNIIIGGNGIYLKWALPQEVRPFYAVADIILNKALGRSPDEKFVEEVGRALLEVLPVNPLGEGGFAQAVVPSFLSPLYEIWQNTDYKGMPLYRESYWSTGEEPKYDKAFSGTGKVFIEISRLLNNVTGGDYAEAGWANIHPAAIEHLIEGYGGGTVTFFNQLLKTLTGNYLTGEWTVRNTPFLNRVVTINDERYRNSHTSDVFKHYENLAKDTKRIYSVYKSNDDVDKIDELMDQKRYDIMKIYERYSKKEERYDDLIRDAEDERERRELMAEQDEIRREMIKEISEL